MDVGQVGRILLILGVIAAIIGGVLVLIAGTPIAAFLRDLPGTLRVQGGAFTCIVPILGSILLSIILTIVLNLVIRFLNRP